MPLKGLSASSLMQNVEYKSILKNLDISSSLLTHIIAQHGDDIKNYTPAKIDELASLSEKDKSTLKNIVKFWGEFQQTLSSDFSFGQKDVYQDFLSSKASMSLADVFRMYALCGGKNMTKAEMNP